MMNKLLKDNIEEREDAPIKWKQIFEALKTTGQIKSKVEQYLK